MRTSDEVAAGVDRLQAAPLYHQIFLQLREEITSGMRAFGSRMPTEQELAQNFAVSRITARRALDELAQTHLVARRRRVGTHVIYRPPPKPIEGDIGQAIEPLIGFGRGTQVKILEMGRVPARAPVSEALQIDLGLPVLRVARLCRLDDLPISYVINYIPAEMDVEITRTAVKTTPMLRLMGARVAIGAATQKVTASLADATLANVLEVEIGSPIVRVSHIVRGVDERPLLHTLALLRPDRFQIRLEPRSPQA